MSFPSSLIEFLGNCCELCVNGCSYEVLLLVIRLSLDLNFGLYTIVPSFMFFIIVMKSQFIYTERQK